MPIFQIDIEKRMGSESWTNVYYVNTPTLADAATFGPEIVACERTFHSIFVNFVKLRARDRVIGTDLFFILPMASVGIINAAAPQILPLFNVLRVDLLVGQGRPSRKYYRVAVDAGALVANMSWATSYTIIAAQNISTLINDNEGILVDTDGQPLLGASVQPVVGMRQLRRGSKRRQQPIL